MDWKYYDFNECEEKVKKAISPYFKAFEELGISVDFVPDCDEHDCGGAAQQRCV